MTKDMTAGSPAKLLLLFAIPMLIGNMFQQLYSLADTDHHRQDIGSGGIGGHRVGRRSTLFYSWLRDWCHFWVRNRHRAAFWHEK
jgi:hypothetical protein